jgi:tetratricopeptide (TPR) repeat protein
VLSYKNFTLKSAEENLQKAIKEANLPLYRQLEGDIAFFQNDFKKASQSYAMVNSSPEANSTSFYLAAKSKQQLEGTPILEIIALMDSAIAKSPNMEASEYLLESIDLKLQLGLYDQVVKDYDKYLLLTGGKVSDAFYYYREQAKFRTGDLEGALKDIDMALMLDNKNALYYAEQASVYLRMGNMVKAQASIEKAIQLEPEFASAYRILGVCLVRQDKKPEACTHFKRAIELGDPVAERLLNENCKE